MAACLDLIAAEGIGAVSLRRVGRMAGVSPGAPYHHFADRAALLAALSVRGFEMLGGQLEAARDRAGTPIEALGAMVEGYVLFARDQPAHFRLMFRPELSLPEKHPDVQAAADRVFDVLTEVVAECQRTGAAPPGDPAPVLTMSWALAHGMASLWIDGRLEHRSACYDTTPAALTRQVARALEVAVGGTCRPQPGERAPARPTP